MKDVIVPSGNIKVNAEELKAAMEITEKLLNNTGIKKAEEEYITYFRKKYVELPSIRLQEQDMYSFVKRARNIAVSQKDMEGVAAIEGNYMEIRGRRIELQKELEEESRNYELFRYGIMEKKPINGTSR